MNEFACSIDEIRTKMEQEADLRLVADERIDPARGEFATAAVAVARLALLFFALNPAKMKEMVHAADMPLAHAIAGPNGADIHDNARDIPVELKSSMGLPLKGGSKGRKCSVNFQAKVVKTAGGKKRLSLSAGLRDKLKNDGIILIVVDRPHDYEFKHRQKYEISGKLFADYCDKAGIDARKNFNLGCVQCRTCQHFHRIKKFADAKVEYTAGGMTNKLLQHLSDKVLSQCLPLESI